LKYGTNNALIATASRVALNSTGTLDLAGFNAGIVSLSDGASGGGAIINSAGTDSILTRWSRRSSRPDRMRRSSRSLIL
jgi:hypothetical protein